MSDQNIVEIHTCRLGHSFEVECFVTKAKQTAKQYRAIEEDKGDWLRRPRWSVLSAPLPDSDKYGECYGLSRAEALAKLKAHHEEKLRSAETGVKNAQARLARVVEFIEAEPHP